MLAEYLRELSDSRVAAGGVAKVILDIALGVALGLLIFFNLRGLIALGALIGLLVLLGLVVCAALWALYSGLQAIRSSPPLLEPGSTASELVGVVFGLLANLMLASAVGTTLERRLGLAAREAFFLGCTLYVLFLLTALSLPFALAVYLEEPSLRPLLLLSVLLFGWILAIRQCVRRARAIHGSTPS